MNSLPSADYAARIATLLDALGDEWQRNVRQGDGCPVDGPCWVHPDSGVPCRGSKGVYSGPLQGIWSALGDLAERQLFDEFVSKLDAGWRQHMAEFGKIAAAMRSVGL